VAAFWARRNKLIWRAIDFSRWLMVMVQVLCLSDDYFLWLFGFRLRLVAMLLK
jgi:hypothetical protein